MTNIYKGGLMNKIVSSFFYVFLTFGLFSTTVFSKELIFNTQDFAPFSFNFNGAVSGPVANIIRIICKEMKVSCTFRLLPWKRAQNEVKNGLSHGMFVIGWNKHRNSWLHFTPPIIDTEYGFFVRDDNPLNFKELSDVKGYVVGVYGPSNTSDSLKNIKKKIHDLTIDQRTNDESGFKKLSKGRVDAVYSNKDVGNEIIKRLHLKNIRYAGKQRKVIYYIGFSKQYTDKSIVDEFNAIFIDLHQRGIIQNILNKYSMQPAETDNIL